MVDRPIRLKIVPKPKTGTRSLLLVHTVLQGPGNLTYICGNCRTTLVEGVYLSDVVIRCPKCQEYNETPILPP